MKNFIKIPMFILDHVLGTILLPFVYLFMLFIFVIETPKKKKKKPDKKLWVNDPFSGAYFNKPKYSKFRNN